MANIIGTQFNDNGTVNGDGQFHPILNGTDSSDFINGLEGNDILIAGGGQDTLLGGAGNDTLDATGAGVDSLFGGSGDDTYFVITESDTLTENRNAGIDTVQSSASYTLDQNVENLVLTGNSDINGTGQRSANNITGNSGNNILSGGFGSDTLFGAGGNDTLTGGGGNDQLINSPGSESFLFEGSFSSIGVDTLNFFNSFSDQILLDNDTFTALDPRPGAVLSGEFAIVASDAGAATSGAVIVYNSSNGNLFYNSNGAGSGFGTGGQFATINSVTGNLTSLDFVVVE